MVGTKFIVVDDFLDYDLSQKILDFAIEQQGNYSPALLTSKKIHDPSWRQSRQLACGLGPHEEAFGRSITARTEEIFAEVGLRPFALEQMETEVIAHEDGDFYRRHIDTGVQDEQLPFQSDRLVTLVYYFNREPKVFSGGELALFGMAGEEPVATIEPIHNRLVAFASFTPHEVFSIKSRSRDFANSRFAVNCWLRRKRA